MSESAPDPRDQAASVHTIRHIEPRYHRRPARFIERYLSRQLTADV
jgi:hypothetical protein